MKKDCIREEERFMNSKKKSGEDIAFSVFIAVFMILFVVVTLYPVLNTLAISFNDGTDALKGPGSLR